MLRNKLYTILLLSFIVSIFYTQTVFAERMYGQVEPPRFKVGRLAVKYEMDAFHARGNFLKNGGSSDLVGDFGAYNAYFGVENDLSVKWSASGGLLLGLSRSFVNQESRRNTDVKGLQFGLSRLFLSSTADLNKGVDVIGDFKFFLSLHDNAFGSDDVSLGDGTSWLQAGVWLGTDTFKEFRLWLYGGLNWPFKGLSKNFIFLGRSELKLKKGYLGLGLEGQVPVIRDDDDPTERLRLSDEYNGGSFYYQGVNSEFIAASFWLGFESASFTEVKIGLAETIFGRSAPKGLRIFVTLELSFSVTRRGYNFSYVKINKGESKIQKNNGVKRLKNYAKPKSVPKATSKLK